MRLGFLGQAELQARRGLHVVPLAKPVALLSAKIGRESASSPDPEAEAHKEPCLPVSSSRPVLCGVWGGAGCGVRAALGSQTGLEQSRFPTWAPSCWALCRTHGWNLPGGHRSLSPLPTSRGSQRWGQGLTGAQCPSVSRVPRRWLSAHGWASMMGTGHPAPLGRKKPQTAVLAHHRTGQWGVPGFGGSSSHTSHLSHL